MWSVLEVAPCSKTKCSHNRLKWASDCMNIGKKPTKGGHLSRMWIPYQNTMHYLQDTLVLGSKVSI